VSDESRVRAVSVIILVYSVLVVAGMMSGALSSSAAPYCVAVLCFGTAAWYVYVVVTSEAVGPRWGLVASAVGWGLVGVAFILRSRGHLWITLTAALFILAGGVAGVLAFRSPPK